jgi:predicted DCC family thiol-disulfide oxidoreductase YuxK
MEVNELPKDKKIILFDGVCNLCDSLVQFVIKKDKSDKFRFVALQSELGVKIILHLGVTAKAIDSIILYEPGTAYYNKTEAVLKIADYIGGIYSLVSVFAFIPISVSNYIYDYIAKNRYKWYGKKESCPLPTAEVKSKFLE